MACVHGFDRLRSILVWSLAILSALNGVAVALADAQSPRRPNIVLLVADDLGINDLGCYGRADHHTPMIDALAVDGVRFLSASSNASVCSPSRAALLTGQHSERLKLTAFLPGRSDRSSHRLLSPVTNQHLPDGVKTLADLLKPAGYRSMCIGKWHLDHTGHGHLGGTGHGPTDHGFDFAFPGNPNPGAESVEGGKGELGQAAAAVQWIDTHADSHAKEPFFLYVAFDSPHIPLASSRQMIDANSKAFHPRYAAMIESLDTAVGRILNALDRRSLKASTLVLFTSDNGGLHVPEGSDPPPTFNSPFRAGKGFLFEGGIRVPLIARLPGRCTQGLVISTPVAIGDLAPTLCHLAGVPAPTPCDFQDISPLLTAGPLVEPAGPLFWHQPHYTNQGGRPAGAIREGNWKLIEHFEDGRLELFDLSQDPGEQNELSHTDPARTAAMRGRLEAWRRDMGTRGMLANPDFDSKAWTACYAATDLSNLKAAKTADLMAPPLAAWRAAMGDRSNGKHTGSNNFIVLEAKDATIVGEKLRYESAPAKDTLGYWVNPADTASWDVTLLSQGRYRVTVLQGCGAGNGGSTVALTIENGIQEPSSLEFTVEETGHFQRFVPRDVGELSLAAGPNRVLVRPIAKKAAAVMDVRRITLERIQ